MKQNCIYLGLPRSIIAGESGGEYSVASAMDLLFATRLGGGYRATERKATWHRIVKQQLHIEAAPTHSIRVACDTWKYVWLNNFV